MQFCSSINFVLFVETAGVKERVGSGGGWRIYWQWQRKFLLLRNDYKSKLRWPITIIEISGRR